METHRKIELQAPEDLTYLLENVRRAAAAHVDEAFPPESNEQGTDEMRQRIEQLVDEYIIKTFDLAAPNLSINGMDADPATLLAPGQQQQQQQQGRSGRGRKPKNQELPKEIVTYEPFDSRKRERVEDLAREEEDLLRDIAHLKRSVPGNTAASWSEAHKKGVKADEEALAQVNEMAASPSSSQLVVYEEDAAELPGEKQQQRSLQLGPLPRQSDVEKNYEGAVNGLGRLKREMPAVVARMERARSAAEYVVTGK